MSTSQHRPKWFETSCIWRTTQKERTTQRRGVPHTRKKRTTHKEEEDHTKKRRTTQGLLEYILVERCVVPSSGRSSFMGYFGTVHYSLQRCSNWGDQVPDWNHLALHHCCSILLSISTLFIVFPLLCSSSPQPHGC